MGIAAKEWGTAPQKQMLSQNDIYRYNRELLFIFKTYPKIQYKADTQVTVSL
jgi:hypothetical protein